MNRTENLTYIKESKFDNRLIFVFKDEKGKIRLIQGDAYLTYKLEPGMVVQAVVREKGCAGEEISELLHPFYRINHSYSFTIEQVKKISVNDSVIHFVIIKDRDNYKYRVKVSDAEIYSVEDKVLCTLTDQKKGKLVFKIEE